MEGIVDNLRRKQHRDSTWQNYYKIWKMFNEFVIHLDTKPRNWEDRLFLFVGHLINENKKSITVRCYISAMKAVLHSNDIKINENKYLLSSLTKACWLHNDTFNLKLPIHKDVLHVILQSIYQCFADEGQLY